MHDMVSGFFYKFSARFTWQTGLYFMAKEASVNRRL